MTFPQTPLPIKQEMLINGVWTDITTRTRGDAQVINTRGYSGEQASLSAGTSAFTLNNRDYAFSNNNPTSPYYRLLGRNIQYRNGIDMSTVSVRFLDAASPGTQTYDGSTVWAPDAAALDVTGDIDVAVDVEFNDVIGRRGHILASKWNGGASVQRSWAFTTTANRFLQFTWTTDGTANTRIIANSPVQINPTGRVQYRATLDVDNGAGGWTCSFYIGTGTDVTGPWTLLGTTSGTGTTSIFSSTARVEIGTMTLGATWPTLTTGTDADPFVGKFYAMTMRNGIAGTLVAFMNAYQKTAGTTSWTDTVSNTWTVTGSSYLSSTDYRFWGEVPSLPNRSDVSNKDVYIPVVANDIVARLSSGKFKKPIRGAVFRNMIQYNWDGYWPMEQNAGSTTLNAYAGKSGTITAADFVGSPAGFDGSTGALNFSDDTGFVSAFCAPSTGTPTTTTYIFYFKLSALPSSSTYQVIMQFYPQNGTASRIALYVNNTSYQMIIIAPDGSALVSTGTAGFGGSTSPVNWTAMRVKLTASGGTVTWEWAWYQINSPTPWGLSGTYSGTVGRPLSWRSVGFTGKSGMQLAHVAMGQFDFNFTGSDFISSTNAFANESWPMRFRRLGAEENFPVFIEGTTVVNGDTSFVHTMGVQTPDTLIELFKRCAEVAGGDLIVPRDKFGLTIRTWEQEINQSGPQLSYSAGAISGKLEPEPDVFLVENDVTLTNPSGSSFRYAKTTGTLNVNDPATDVNGVGTYDVSDTINLYDAAELEQAVRRRVLFGTWDEARWPKIQVQLERNIFTSNAALTAQCRKVDLLRPISLINLTPNLSYNAVDLMAVGYVETMSQFTHALNWNVRPGGPWKTGVWGSAASPTTSLWGAASTTLKTGVNTTAVSLTFTTPDVFETWSTTASGYQVEIAGERMTIVSVGARSGSGPYDYAVTVTRSANGVVKSLSAGEPVTVVKQGRWT